MNIAGLSMSLASSSNLNNVGTKVLAKSLDTMKEAGEGLNRLIQEADPAAMERSVYPNLGANIDLKL